MHDIKANSDLPTSPPVMAMRFDRRLCFANVSYLEDAVLEALAERPSTRVVLIVRDAINQLDASDEEILHHVVERLHAAGIMLVFLGLKRQIIGVMRQTGLIKALGEDNLFATGSQAITAIYQRPGESAKGDLFRPVKPEAA